MEIRALARPRLVSTLRAAVTDLTATADFDLDTIADLRLAVDEACTSLIRLSEDRSVLVCVANVLGNRVEVTVRTDRAIPGSQIDTSGFGWRVLEALTDSAWVEPGSNGSSNQLAIRFVRNGR